MLQFPDIQIISCFIGLIAGFIFFIDGWSPTVKNKRKKESSEYNLGNRYRALGIVVGGGILSPIVDKFFVDGSQRKFDFFFGYLWGVILGWFGLFVIALVMYIIWRGTKGLKEDDYSFKLRPRYILYAFGQLCYSIIDFIYFGIGDNPLLDIERKKQQDEAKERKGSIPSLELDVPRTSSPTLVNASHSSTFSFEEYKVYFDKGNELFKNGLFKEALESFQKAHTLNLKDLGSSLNIAVCYEKLKDYVEAENSYLEAIKNEDLIDTNNEKYLLYFDYGNLLMTLNRDEEAIKYFDQSLKFKNDSATWLIKGNLFYKKDEFNEALKCYEKAIGLTPSYSTALYNKGLCYYHTAKYADALLFFDKALETQNENPADVYICIGLTYSCLDRPYDAIAAYDKAIEKNSNNEKIYLNKAIVFEHLGKSEEAIKIYDQALNINKDYTDAWNNKGTILEKLGKIEEAKTAYEKTLSIDKNYKYGLYNMARIYAMEKRKEKSLEFLAKCLQEDKKFKNDAKTDPAFHSLIEDNDFQRMIN